MIRLRNILVLPLALCLGAFVVGQDKVEPKQDVKPEVKKVDPKDPPIEWVGKDDPKQPPKRLIPAPQPKDVDGPPMPPAQPAQAEDGPSTKLAFQALLTPSKSDGIELVPATVTIQSSKRFQIVTAKTEGKVKWMIFNQGKEPVEWLQLPGTKSIQVFPNYGVDDVITVYAYSAIGNEPTDPVKSVITVGRETKKPLPTSGEVENKDDPKVDPVVGDTFHLTIITDGNLKTTNKILDDLVNSVDLKAGVQNRGHKIWIFDQTADVQKIKDRGFDEYVRKINRIPLYVIQNGSGTVVDSGPLPTTLVSVIQKLDAVTPRPAVRPDEKK